MKTITILAALAAMSIISTTKEAEAARTKHPAPPQAGHLAPDNNGHFSWTPDAQGGPRAQRRAASHKTAARSATGGAHGAPASLHEAAKAGVGLSHNGMVTVATAQGFKITVHPAYASKFLRFFALLKERGYKVPASITRCWAPRGTHVAGSNHYIGAACDIQTGWNRGPAFVYHMDAIVREAGLFSGCAFRDCGHVEAVRGTHNQAPNLYAAVEKFKSYESTMRYQP